MAGLADLTLGNFTKFYYGDVGSDGEYQDATSPVQNVASVGEISDEATIVDVQAYGDKYLKKLAGSANAGTLEIVCNLSPTDTYYSIFEKAYKDNIKKSFKLEMLESAATDAKSHFISFVGYVASKSFSNEFDSTRQVTWNVAISGAISDLTATPDTP